MYVDIEKVTLLRFNNCKDCNECCKNKFLAPLILEDFKKVYNFFPILIAKLDTFKPVMLLSNNISCPYLKNSRCQIYNNRPPACKIYPFSPWYNSILLDISCKGVGIEGDRLPLTKDEFYRSKFFDSRVIDIEEKLQETLNWLKNKRLNYFKSIFGIKLYLIEGDDEYVKMHKKSLIFLKNYQKILT